MTAPEERFIQAARKGVSMLADFAQGLLDDIEQTTSGQASEKKDGPKDGPEVEAPEAMGGQVTDLLTDCPDHKPIQHRDGKKPWCRLCGCDAEGNLIGTLKGGWAAAAMGTVSAAEQRKMNCPSAHDTINRGDQGQEGWFCRDCDAAFAPVNPLHATMP